MEKAMASIHPLATTFFLWVNESKEMYPKRCLENIFQFVKKWPEKLKCVFNLVHLVYSESAERAVPTHSLPFKWEYIIHKLTTPWIATLDNSTHMGHQIYYLISWPCFWSNLCLSCNTIRYHLVFGQYLLKYIFSKLNRKPCTVLLENQCQELQLKVM